VTERHEVSGAAVVVVDADTADVVVVAAGGEVVVVLLLPDPDVVSDDVLDPPGFDEQAANVKPALSTMAHINGRRISR
jgi:hypothetical protein